MLKYFEREGKELILKNNIIFRGDNFDYLADLPSESIDLIMIDPQWNSNEDYYSIDYAGNVQFFKDIWKDWVWSYIGDVYPRVEQMHRILKPFGSFYFHCDQHASHYIKVYILDKIFGPHCCRNEIIWHYRRWPAEAYQYQRMHDTIFFYTKSPVNLHTFNPPYKPYSSKTVHRKISVDGKTDLSETRDLEKGTKLDDVWSWPDEIWDDIPYLHSQSKERKEGKKFKTQKPIALAQRIIEASSNPGDTILDPYLGSGTTAVAAYKTNRKFMGMEYGKTTFDNIVERLTSYGAKFETVLGDAIEPADIWKLPGKKFEIKLMEIWGGMPNYKEGTDGGTDGRHKDGKYTQVKKRQIKVDDVREMIGTLVTKGESEGYLIGVGTATRNARMLAKQTALDRKIHVILKKAEDIIEPPPQPQVDLITENNYCRAKVVGLSGELFYTWQIDYDKGPQGTLFGVESKPQYKNTKKNYYDFSDILSDGNLHTIRCIVSTADGDWKIPSEPVTLRQI